jgi:hypothetical protein
MKNNALLFAITFFAFCVVTSFLVVGLKLKPKTPEEVFHERVSAATAAYKKAIDTGDDSDLKALEAETNTWDVVVSEIDTSVSPEWDKEWEANKKQWKIDNERRGPTVNSLHILNNGTNLCLMVWSYGARKSFFSRPETLIHRFIIPNTPGDSQFAIYANGEFRQWPTNRAELIPTNMVVEARSKTFSVVTNYLQGGFCAAIIYAGDDR